MKIKINNAICTNVDEIAEQLNEFVETRTNGKFQLYYDCSQFCIVGNEDCFNINIDLDEPSKIDIQVVANSGFQQVIDDLTLIKEVINDDTFVNIVDFVIENLDELEAY